MSNRKLGEITAFVTESCRDCRAEVVYALTDAGMVMALEPEPSVDGTYSIVDADCGGRKWRVRALFLYADERRRGLLHRAHRCTRAAGG